MSPKFIFLFTFSCGLVAYSWCYPSGAPQETCKIFTANHTGQSAQNSRSKYDIKINPASVKAGGKATVTISGDMFKGFFIQAFDESNKPVGQFKPKAGIAQTRDCNGPRSATAATHTSSKDKSVVSLDWEAPRSYGGSVVFRAVVVKTYEKYWDNVQSRPVKINP